MPKNFNEKMIELLKTDARFVDEEGELVKAAVIDRAWKIDHDLVRLLLGDADIKAKFFDEIEGHWIFNINIFIEYVSDKNFLADSYTRFRNRIGLNLDDKFLRERGEVSLVWPYKDCVLEGGQTKEEEKRKEIFFNKILAQDEIDRLFDPKVLINWKRYTVDGEEDVMGLRRDERGTIRENLIIKGNNLLALHTLKTQFLGKVKLIYIDPPYNTGNDSFGYNDSFNHSSWLTFMKNRLEAAYQLLSNDGSIFIQLDYNQIHYCKILMDEVFGKENFRNEIVWQRTTNTGSSKGRAQKLSNDTDSILYYAKSKNNIFNKQYKPYSDKYLKRFKYKDERGYYRWQYMATYSEQKLKELKKKNMIRWEDKDQNPEYKQYLHELKGIPLNNLWTDIFHINPMANESVGFKTQKPEELLARIIKLASNEKDIVMDFFLGSATTCSVAHKLDRQYIGIEQLEYSNQMPVNRLRDTLIGKDIGTLKEIDWQGGGDFIYCELMQYNEVYMDKIQAAKSSKELVALWRDIAENSFLNWYVNPEIPEDAVNDFIAIGEGENGVSKQKKLLVELLDKNQLYVNLSEIDDEDFGISAGDKELNEEFYGQDPDEGLELRDEFVAELQQTIADVEAGGKTTPAEKVAEELGLNW